MWWLGIPLIFLFLGGAKMGDAQVDPFFRWDTLIEKYAKITGVPFSWIKAVMLNESNLGRDPRVKRGLENPQDIEGSKSSDGKSWGLMQLTLNTARQFESAVTAVGLNDPETSIRIGAKYLAYLGRIKAWDMEKVIRSYNGGPGYLNTIAGVRDTPIYFAKFQSNLDTVRAKNRVV